jgi:hypothetical protein
MNGNGDSAAKGPRAMANGAARGPVLAPGERPPYDTDAT